MEQEQVFRYNVHNDSQNSIVVMLEPWAEYFDVLPGKTLQISAYYSLDGNLETIQTDRCFVVCLWGGCRAMVSIDDQDCTPATLKLDFPNWPDP
jgi:hypothetical protein